MARLTQQQEQASQLGNHLLVTANAGSGKTKVLSGRYVKALLEENVKVNEIAALTFGEKATAELYARIRKELVSVYDTTTDQNEKIRIDKMIRDLINSNISTIHSFCASILREFPVEAGIDPSFNLVAENESKQLIIDSATDIIAESLADPGMSQEIKKAIRLFRSTEKFKAAIVTMIKQRKKIQTYSAYLENDISPENILNKNTGRIGDYINILFPTLDDLVLKLKELNDFIHEEKPTEVTIQANAAFAIYKTDLDPVAKYVAISRIMNEISTQGGDLRKQRFLDKNILPKLGIEKTTEYLAVYQYLKGFFWKKEKIDPENVRHLLSLHAEYTSLLLRFFQLILNCYNNKKSELNCIDFDDMILMTADILKKPAVKKALAGKFKYIMVDEYQDTDDLQFDIFLPLLDDLSTGNLYVVGDKKQSIYGFRNADLAVFDRTKRRIERSSGTSVVLEHTFRLTKELTAFVNTIFPPIFASKDPLFDGTDAQFAKKRELTNAVDYEQTSFFDINKPYKESTIGLIINRGTDDSKDDVAKRLTKEAQLLARHLKQHFEEIKKASESEKEPLTIAILTRKRNNFAYLEAALTELNIPYELMGGKQFYQQQVVADISSVFNFLADPSDDLNLYSLLRSPFFSLSDADILAISNAPGLTAFERLGIVAGDDHPRMHFALRFLNELLLLSTGVRPHKIIDIVLSRTPYLAITASRPGGKQNLANINKLLSLSVQFDSFRFNSLHDYRKWLEELILQEESETQAPVSESEGSVKLMTMHLAKGLEFTTVYLFGCGEAAYATNNQTEGGIEVHKDLGLVFKVSRTGDIFYKNLNTLHYDLAELFNKEVEAEEAKRLFYVAVTRAANNLFITGSLLKGEIEKKSSLRMLVKGLGMETIPEEDFTISSGPLKIASDENNQHKEEIIDSLVLSIKVLKPGTVENIQKKTPEKAQKSAKPVIATGRIEKKYSGEIISASKYLTWYQCPFKYYLTYISGLSGIPGLEDFFFPRQDEIETSYDPADDNGLTRTEGELPGAPVGNTGAATGTVVHEYLATAPSGVTLLNAVTAITGALTGEDPTLLKSREEIISRSVDILTRFLSTDTAKKISGYTNFRNEEELFIRYNDYYLMGVIDKLVILEDRIIIIDYKTDRSPAHSLDRYREQLRFYAYICSLVYPSINIFELRLVFLIDPEVVQPEILSRTDIAVVKEKIDSLISLLRGSFASGEFNKNTSHCGECRFSFNTGNCLAREPQE